MVVVNEEITTKFDCMTNKELGAYIRGKLNEKGYNSRKVSVSVKDCGYSTSIHCTIKDLSIDDKEIENIVNEVEYIRYDSYAQEILAGCNRFVDVRYDWKLKNEAQNAQLENAKEIINNSENSFIYTDENGTKFSVGKENRKFNGQEWIAYSIWKWEKDKNYGTLVQSNMTIENVYYWLALNLAFVDARKAA